MSAAVEIVRSAIDVMREEIRKEICEEIRAQRVASKLRRQEESLWRKHVREQMKEEKRQVKEMLVEQKRREKELIVQAKLAMMEEKRRMKEMMKQEREMMKEEELREKAQAKQAKMEQKLQEMEARPAYVRCECGCILRTTSLKQHRLGNKHACLLQAQLYDSEEEKMVWNIPDDYKVHPWTFQGKTYLVNSERGVWERKMDGTPGKWVGMVVLEENRIDDSVPEPEYYDE